MIAVCITGVALFYTVFFYTVMKFQQNKKTQIQHLKV